MQVSNQMHSPNRCKSSILRESNLKDLLNVTQFMMRQYTTNFFNTINANAKSVVRTIFEIYFQNNKPTDRNHRIAHTLAYLFNTKTECQGNEELLYFLDGIMEDKFQEKGFFIPIGHQKDWFWFIIPLIRMSLYIDGHNSKSKSVQFHNYIVILQ